MEYTISLVGNPNVGKTSLYNRITHSLEHVGNWHGVTVSEVSKTILFDHHTVHMVDLPGLYSLSVYSYEESISRDRILQKNSDLVVNICEVNNLARNLYLTLQLLELDIPMVLVINMMDELHKQGNVYVLDEPSTGLHSRDAEQLLALLRRLVDQGNTVVIVEHRLSLIAAADWVIDMGPEGGSGGGEILFAGTPARLMDCPRSETGKYMRQLAEEREKRPEKAAKQDCHPEKSLL